MYADVRIHIDIRLQVRVGKAKQQCVGSRHIDLRSEKEYYLTEQKAAPVTTPRYQRIQRERERERERALSTREITLSRQG